MMIEDKQNILKSFEGRKIDESVHVKRWGTINNESNEDSNRLIFNKYAVGGSDSRQQSVSQENLFATQESQVHEIDTGFKKLKNNQIQKLKELKQEYEVLRNLNIEQKPSISHPKVHSESSSSVHQTPLEESLSSSSRHKKSIARNENTNREAQILSLQKKQLEMVINNSMRKIEELLHNEMEYKKQIHQLKLQVSGRQNVDVEYEAMIKTLKKNQLNQMENNEALKKQNEKNKFQMRQLTEKIATLESEIMMKDQEIRLLLGEKRKSEDLIRLQKDRYFNLDIDYKKTKMEYELLEKDKNNEINRLMKQLDYSGTSKTRDLQLKLKRYEDDIQIKDRRYNVLLAQIQDLKMRHTLLEQEIQQYRHNQAAGQLDKDKIEEMLMNFREQNDSVAFGRQMNQVINKLQEVDHHENDFLRQQIETLKMELSGLRQNEKVQSQPVFNVQQYLQRIDELQRMLRSECQEKDEAVSRLKRLEREHEDMGRKLSQNQREIQEYESLEGKLREEIRGLRDEIKIVRQKTQTQTYDSVRPPVQIQSQPIHYDNKQSSKQLEMSLMQTTKYKQQLQQLQTELRSTKRLADQNDFKASKTATELEFRLKMQQTEHNAVITRLGEDMERERREYLRGKEEFEQYRQVMERKLTEKESELENLKAKLRMNSDGTQTNINNIRLQYESLLKSDRQQYKLQIQQLSTQITSLSRINQKYMQESSKYVHYENELSCLRQIMRRSIHLSEGVDHLWRIKEAEYQNANQVLRQLREWRK